MWLYCFIARENSIDATLVEPRYTTGSVLNMMRVRWILLCDGLTSSDSLLLFPLIFHHRHHYPHSRYFLTFVSDSALLVTPTTIEQLDYYSCYS